MADDHTIHRLIVDDYPLKGFSTEPSTTISISTLLMQFFIARSPSMEGHYDRIRVDTAKVMKSIRLSGERLAESVLKSLVAAAEGTAWELLLRHDLEVYRRDARALDYSLITPADLAKVIDSKGPISVRDLRALTLMELHKVAAENPPASAAPTGSGGTTLVFHHAQFGIIEQGLGQGAEVVRGPEQLGFVFHQAVDGQVADVAHQFRGLFAGALAGDAGFDAEEGMGLVITLEEGGFAYCELGFFCGHWLISLRL